MDIRPSCDGVCIGSTDRCRGQVDRIRSRQRNLWHGSFFRRGNLDETITCETVNKRVQPTCFIAAVLFSNCMTKGA